MSPFRERYGQGGWVYSEPADFDKCPDEESMDIQMAEDATGLKWYPELEWEENETKSLYFPVFSAMRKGLRLMDGPGCLSPDAAAVFRLAGRHQVR